MNLNSFKTLPVFGILRGIEGCHIPIIDKIMRSTGLKAIEITMNTKAATALIRSLRQLAKGDYFIGAGTVLNLNELDHAFEAGASFIVSPTLIGEVVKNCVSQKIPVFPGALTPTEIQRAWDSGATMVKVFPASVFGPKYFKEIKGPFEDIELLACGGVTPKTVRTFFENGASAVSFGSRVFKHDLLTEENMNVVCDGINKLLDGYRNW